MGLKEIRYFIKLKWILSDIFILWDIYENELIVVICCNVYKLCKFRFG